MIHGSKAPHRARRPANTVGMAGDVCAVREDDGSGDPAFDGTAGVAVRESEERLQAIIANLSEGLVVSDFDGQLLHWNPAALALHGFTDSAEWCRRLPEFQSIYELATLDGTVVPFDQWPMPRVIRGESLRECELRIRRLDADWQRIFSYTGSVVRDAGGHPLVFLAIRDVTARKQAEALLQGQNRILAMVALGEPLPRTLHALLALLEAQADDMFCSILLLDTTGRHLRHGAAPRLPEDYCQAIDGAPIGPSVGSCGTAAFRGEAVLVTDIATDPLWADYKHLALAHGLKACWSTPILDAGKRVLGTFAIYFRAVGPPQNRHRELISFATHTAAICIGRQRVESALVESEARYALAVRGTNDGIWDWDIVAGTNYLSPRWKALLGFADDELPNVPESFFARIHPDDLGRAEAAVQAHLEHRNPYDLELRLRTKEGAYRWFRCRGQAEWNVDGKPTRMAGAISDIHPRKQAEAALEHERTQATAVLNSLSSHIAVVDRDGVVLAVNESWRQFARENNVGDTGTVTPGINYLGVVERSASTGDTLARRALDGIRQVLRGESPRFELEYPCNSPEQDRRFLMIVTSLQGGAGAVLAHEDITARVLAQEALRDAAQFNRQIIESADDGIVVLDRDLRYIVWNHFMEELMGKRAEEVLGKHPEELFGWVRKGGQLAAMKRALAGETVVVPDSMRIKTGSNRVCWVQARLSALRNAGNEIVGVIVTIIDVTERKEAEEHLRRSHEQMRALAARLQSVREEQSAHIAREIHDVLGQQLTALKLDLAWMKRRMMAIADPAIRVPLTDKLAVTTGLVDETIHTVQKVATELRPGLLDKLGLAAALGHEAREFALRTGLDCEIDFVAGPLALTEEQEIGLFRVCQEMLTNVARHAQARKVRVRLAHQEENLILEVHDDGRGIEETEVNGARSLGVLGMKERAQLLGGTLAITGAPGAGTRARLSIPWEEAP